MSVQSPNIHFSTSAPFAIFLLAALCIFCPAPFTPLLPNSPHCSGNAFEFVLWHGIGRCDCNIMISFWLGSQLHPPASPFHRNLLNIAEWCIQFSWNTYICPNPKLPLRRWKWQKYDSVERLSELLSKKDCYVGVIARTKMITYKYSLRDVKIKKSKIIVIHERSMF